MEMAIMHSDLEIARAAKKLPIAEVAGRLGIPASQLVPYGHDKAKIAYEFLESLHGKKNGKLILVSAISPTPVVTQKRII